jgi:tetratricopeptide (TPR) repeat protein
MKPAKRGHSERNFLKNARIALIAVVSWFLVTTAGELIGNQANETSSGQALGRLLLIGAVIIAPLAVAVSLGLYWWQPRKGSSESKEDSVASWPAPQEPPAWHRPNPLYRRDSEVKEALRTALDGGLVAVIGPRDVGTSAVAETVVQKLLDDHEALIATRFDLRSRSSKRADDARATAGRIVSSFHLDEPADSTPELLAGAARRLVSELAGNYDVLLLDNASTPEEVEWIVREWPASGPPWLVIAGESALAPVTDGHCVFVDELDLAGLRAIWAADLPDTGLRSRIFRGRLAANPERDALLRACFGRPQAVKAFIREIVRTRVTEKSLLESVNSTGPAEGPLERVWTAILDHVRDGLSDDAVWLLHSLAELPVTALTKPAIAAMLGSRRNAEDVLVPLDELRIRNLVQEVDGRYRVAQEIRRALAATTGDDDRRTFSAQAMPPLLRHYGEQAERWAGRLPAGGAEWFHDAERSLRPLLARESYPDDELLLQVIDELARIGDALEVWYVREQQSGGLLAVNEGLHGLAERANRPELAGIAAIRIATAHRMVGRLGEADAMLDVAGTYATRLRADDAAELDVREQVERALVAMTGSRPDRESLGQAEKELTRVLGSHRDETIVLINLGALCLRLGRPDDARTHLRKAERLAVDRRDIGAQAHAIELHGVALSFTALPDAVRLWRQAWKRFDTLGEEQGVARCLQHLGAAALVDATVAGLIRDGRPTPLTEREAAAVALLLLEQSKRLRAGQPATALVDDYLAVARARLEDR